jgi:hypothetical protein
MAVGLDVTGLTCFAALLVRFGLGIRGGCIICWRMSAADSGRPLLAIRDAFNTALNGFFIAVPPSDQTC